MKLVYDVHDRPKFNKMLVFALQQVLAIMAATIGGLAIKIPYMIDGNGVVTKAITITSVATALILGIATYAVCNKLEKKDGAVEEEIEKKSIVTEAAVQVGVVDTLVQTEEAPAEAVAEEATVEATETVETTEEN